MYMYKDRIRDATEAYILEAGCRDGALRSVLTAVRSLQYLCIRY